MAITGSVYTPGSGGTGNAWVNEVWANLIDREAYELAVIYPLIKEYPSLHGKLHIPKHAALSASTISGTTDMSGFGLTFSANTEVEKTITPSTVNLNVSVNANQIARMMVDPQDTLRTSIDMSIAQNIDQGVATLFQALSTNISGSYAAPLDKSAILEAKSKVKAGAKEYASDQINFCYHHLQDDSVMSIGDFVQAYVRGDAQNPAVGGKIIESFGIRFYSTGNIRNAGGGFNNCMFISRAFGISFNQKPTVKAQEDGLATWLLGWADYGTDTVRDGYAALLKSNAA